MDHEIEKLNKQQREHQNRLEAEKSKEREFTEKINDDVKELEKMTNKQSLLLKKVIEIILKNTGVWLIMQIYSQY